MGRDPHPAGPRRRRHAALQPHRRRYFGQLSRRRGGVRDQGRARRRTAGARRRRRAPTSHGGAAASFNALQQRLGRKNVSAKVQGQYPAFVRLYDILFDGDEDVRALAVERAPRAARGVRRAARSRALRPVATDRGRQLRGARGNPRRGARRGRRGHDAQAPRLALCRGAQDRAVVQMEARPADRRLRDDVCPARVGKAVELLQRLHLRRVGRRTANCCPSARPISASPTRN